MQVRKITESATGKKIVDLLADGVKNYFDKKNLPIPQTFEDFEKSQILKEAREGVLNGGIALSTQSLQAKFITLMLGSFGLEIEEKFQAENLDLEKSDIFTLIAGDDPFLEQKLSIIGRLFSPGSISKNEKEKILSHIFNTKGLPADKKQEVLARREDVEIIIDAFSGKDKCQRKLIFERLQEKFLT